MRTFLLVGIALALSFSAVGCGGNQAKAEALAQQMIDEMNRVAEGFEKGDKAAVKASIAKLSELGKQAKDVKVTKTQDKAVEAKFKPQMEAAQKRMMDAVMKATTSGKMTPQDMMELGKDLQDVGKNLKAGG